MIVIIVVLIHCNSINNDSNIIVILLHCNSNSIINSDSNIIVVLIHSPKNDSVPPTTPPVKTTVMGTHHGLHGEPSHLLPLRTHHPAHQLLLSEGIIPSVQVGVARKNGVHVPWNGSATTHKREGGRGEGKGWKGEGGWKGRYTLFDDVYGRSAHQAVVHVSS